MTSKCTIFFLIAFGSKCFFDIRIALQISDQKELRPSIHGQINGKFESLHIFAMINCKQRINISQSVSACSSGSLSSTWMLRVLSEAAVESRSTGSLSSHSTGSLIDEEEGTESEDEKIGRALVEWSWQRDCYQVGLVVFVRYVSNSFLWKTKD